MTEPAKPLGTPISRLAIFKTPIGRLAFPGQQTFEHPGASWQHRNSRDDFFSDIRGLEFGCPFPGECGDSVRFNKPCKRPLARRLVLSVLSFTLLIPPGETLRLGAGQKPGQEQASAAGPDRARILDLRHRSRGERGRRGHGRQWELFEGPEEGKFPDHRGRHGADDHEFRALRSADHDRAAPGIQQAGLSVFYLQCAQLGRGLPEQSQAQ